MIEFHGNKLDPDVEDALREIGNVGVGQASIALGKILDVELTISVPRIMQVDDGSIPFPDSGGNTINMGILMTMETTFRGVVLFIVDKDFVSNIVFKYTGKRLLGDELLDDEDSLSATQELANVMAAAYIKAIGAYTGMRLFLSPAMVGIDELNSLVAFTISHFNPDGERIICVDTGFGLMENGRKTGGELGRIIMLPDKSSVEKIAKLMGVKP